MALRKMRYSKAVPTSGTVYENGNAGDRWLLLCLPVCKGKTGKGRISACFCHQTKQENCQYSRTLSVSGHCRCGIFGCQKDRVELYQKLRENGQNRTASLRRCGNRQNLSGSLHCKRLVRSGSKRQMADLHADRGTQLFL